MSSVSLPIENNTVNNTILTDHEKEMAHNYAEDHIPTKSYFDSASKIEYFNYHGNILNKTTTLVINYFKVIAKMFAFIKDFLFIPVTFYENTFTRSQKIYKACEEVIYPQIIEHKKQASNEKKQEQPSKLSKYVFTPLAVTAQTAMSTLKFYTSAYLIGTLGSLAMPFASVDTISDIRGHAAKIAIPGAVIGASEGFLQATGLEKNKVATHVAGAAEGVALYYPFLDIISTAAAAGIISLATYFSPGCLTSDSTYLNYSVKTAIGSAFALLGAKTRYWKSQMPESSQHKHI